MTTKPAFIAAFPFQKDVLTLPVKDLSEASQWYCKHFGMNEVQRDSEGTPSVVLQRDDARIGFEVNGRDATQDGAAILVRDIHALKAELENTGLEVGDFRTDERDGKLLTVFFVVAPDGLCYYFHEPQDAK